MQNFLLGLRSWTKIYLNMASSSPESSHNQWFRWFTELQNCLTKDIKKKEWWVKVNCFIGLKQFSVFIFTMNLEKRVGSTSRWPFLLLYKSVNVNKMNELWNTFTDGTRAAGIKLLLPWYHQPRYFTFTMMEYCHF